MVALAMTIAMTVLAMARMVLTHRVDAAQTFQSARTR